MNKLQQFNNGGVIPINYKDSRHHYKDIQKLRKSTSGQDKVLHNLTRVRAAN